MRSKQDIAGYATVCSEGGESADDREQQALMRIWKPANRSEPARTGGPTMIHLSVRFARTSLGGAAACSAG